MSSVHLSRNAMVAAVAKRMSCAFVHVAESPEDDTAFMRVSVGTSFCDLKVPRADRTLSADAFGEKYAALADQAFGNYR